MASDDTLATKSADAPFYGFELGIDMIDILVGPSKRVFRVHRTLLCSRVPYFDKMFNGGFKEAGDQRGELPEEYCDTFNLFLEWLYTKRIPSFNIAKHDPSKPYETQFMRRAKLYCFAEKHCIDELMDYTVTELLGNYREHNRTPTFEVVEHVYEHTSQSSKLRVFMCNAVRYITIAKPDNIDWSTVDLVRLMTSHSALASDVLGSMRNTNDDSITNPNLFNASQICRFHVHGDREACTAKLDV